VTPFSPDAASLRAVRERYTPFAALPSSRAVADAGFDAVLEQAVEIPTGGRHGPGADPDGDTSRGAAGSFGGFGQGREPHRNQQNITLEGAAPSTCNDSSIQIAPPSCPSCEVSLDAASQGALGPLPEELRKLVRVLRSSSLSGRRGVSLTLSLGELGEVRFDVRLDGKEVHIRAAVGDQRAAAALTLSLGELERRLGECDLALGGFEIAVGRMPRRGDDKGKGGAVTVTAVTRR
jgi:hypothetical protein